MGVHWVVDAEEVYGWGVRGSGRVKRDGHKGESGEGPGVKGEEPQGETRGRAGNYSQLHHTWWIRFTTGGATPTIPTAGSWIHHKTVALDAADTSGFSHFRFVSRR